MAANLELYRIFTAVAHAGSFSRAAAALYITQPAVSQAIAALEAQLDTHLFKRSRKGVSLTPQGELLLGYAETSLNLLQSGENRLEQLRQLGAGSLRIGAGDTITKNLLLPYIQRFHSSHPQVSISVTNRTSRQLLRLLQTGDLDIVVANLAADIGENEGVRNKNAFLSVNGPLDNTENIRVEPCFTVNDIFVAGRGFGNLRDKTLTCAELAALPLVMLEKQSNSRMYVQNFFLRRGVELMPEIELGAYDLLCEFADIGLGVACVIKQFSEEYLESGRLFEVKQKTPLPPRSIAVCSLKNIALSAAAKQFTEMLAKRL